MKTIPQYALPFLLLLAGCATPPPPAPAPARERTAPAPVVQKKTVAPTFLPRVMVIVDEKSLGTIATAEVEAMAIKKLTALNVPVVDQDMVRANVARSQQMLAAAGDNRGAAALGTQFGADIVVIGEAVAKPSARRISDTNLRSYQAVATLRAVRTDNSATLAAASEDVTQVGLEDVSGSAKVLRAAGEKALDALLPELLAKWTPGDASGAEDRRGVAVEGGGVALVRADDDPLQPERGGSGAEEERQQARRGADERHPSRGVLEDPGLETREEARHGGRGGDLFEKRVPPARHGADYAARAVVVPVARRGSPPSRREAGDRPRPPRSV